MTYDEFTAYMVNMLQIADSAGVALFNSISGAMIDFIENRLFRDLDMIDVNQSATSTCVASSRNIALPANMIVPKSCNIITPAGDAPDDGTRNPVVPTTIDFVNNAYPGSSPVGNPSIPLFFARLSSTSIIIAPAPDDTYTAEFIGAVVPTQLSTGNQTNVFGQYFPDLYVCLGMVFGSAYQRELGMQGDPGMATAWESLYGKLLGSAETQEMRKKLHNFEGRLEMRGGQPTVTPQMAGG